MLVLEDQNPSNVMQWQSLCEEEGGALVVVKRPPDDDWARAIVALVDGGTVAICALPPCHWCDGSLVDLPPIGEACRRSGASFVLDVTQWLGAAPAIDPVALGVCFLACSIHKWLLGPYGVRKPLDHTARPVWSSQAP